MAKQPSKTNVLACLVLCVLLAMTMALTACNSPKTPMGSDKDVQKLVLEIVTDGIRDNMACLLYMNMTNCYLNPNTPNIYDGLVANIDAGINRQVVEATDDVMKKVDISIANIRTDKIQDNIKKSTSSANVELAGQKPFPITFTAQLADDGYLYVEVFGLELFQN